MGARTSTQAAAHRINRKKFPIDRLARGTSRARGTLVSNHAAWRGPASLRDPRGASRGTARSAPSLSGRCGRRRSVAVVRGECPKASRDPQRMARPGPLPDGANQVFRYGPRGERDGAVGAEFRGRGQVGFATGLCVASQFQRSDPSSRGRTSAIRRFRITMPTKKRSIARASRLNTTSLSSRTTPIPCNDAGSQFERRRGRISTKRGIAR